MSAREVPYRKIHPQFNDTFEYYSSIPDTIRESLWNYFAYGLPPGGFMTAVLQNDFIRAMGSSDSSWNGKSFKDLGKWIMHYAPRESYGSEDAMKNWMEKTDVERRDIMIELRFRPSEFDILRGLAIA